MIHWRAAGVAAALLVPASLTLTACTSPPAHRGTPALPPTTWPAGTRPSATNVGPDRSRLVDLNRLGPRNLAAAYTSPPGCARWTGSEVVTRSDGCTIMHVRYTGDFVVRNDRTVLEDDEIIGPGSNADGDNNIIVKVNWGSGRHGGTVIRNSDIHDGSPSGSVYCVAGFEFTLVADDIHNCAHDVQLYGRSDHVSITRSYIHGNVAPASYHVDLLYASPGASDVTLTANSFLIDPVGGTSACVFLDGQDQDHNWTIVGNWFDGSQPESANWGAVQSRTQGITFTGNRIGLNFAYGPYQFYDFPTVSAGNVWMYSGPIPQRWRNHGSLVRAGDPILSG